MSDHLLDASWLRFSSNEALGDNTRLEIRLEMPVNVGTGKSGAEGKLWSQSFARLHLPDGQSITVGKQFHAGVDRISDTLDTFEVSGSKASVLPLALIATDYYAGLSGRIERVIKYRAVPHGSYVWSASFAPAAPGYGRSESLEGALTSALCDVGAVAIRYHAPAERAAAAQSFLGIGGKCRQNSSVVFLAFYRNHAESLSGSQAAQRNAILHAGLTHQLSTHLKLRGALYVDHGRNLDNVLGRAGTKRTLATSLEWQLSVHSQVYVAALSNTFRKAYVFETRNLEELGRRPGSTEQGEISVGMKLAF